MVCAAAFAVRYVVDRNGARAAADYGLALAASSVVGVLRHRRPGSLDARRLRRHRDQLGGAGGDRRARALRSAARCRSDAHAGAAGVRARRSAAPRSALFVVDRAALPARALRHDGPGGVADLARACARDAAADSADGEEPAHRRSRSRHSRSRRSSPRSFCCATRPAARLRLPRRVGRVRVAPSVTTLAAVKGASYATWLGMPLVAAFALHLFAALQLQSLVPRFAVGMLLTPAALSLGAISIANAAGIGDRTTASTAPRREACFKTESYAALAQLPPRPDRGRHRLRTVPAGAHAARGAGRALSPLVRRHRGGASGVRVAAR